VAGLARDELVRALTARVRLFAVTFERAEVLSAEAVDQAQALMAAVPDPSRDQEAVGAVADLYRCRAMLLEGAAGEQAAAIAAALDRLAGPKQADQSLSSEELTAAHRYAADQVRVAERDPDPAVLASALKAADAAVAATPAGLLPYRAGGLANLGTLLRLRYERAGALQDLHDAVGALRQAEAAAGSTHPDRAAIVSALGVVLRERFERAGSLADLQESVGLGRAAVAATPDADFNQGGRLSNLGIALRLRFERTGVPGDLDEAIGMHRRAVSVTPPGHPGSAIFLTGLGNALSARYDQSGDEADLRALVAAHEAALAAAGPADERRARLLTSLGTALTRSYEANGNAEDADRAVELLDAAAAFLPVDHSGQTAVRYQLGQVLWARHERSGQGGDAAAAVAHYRAAARNASGPPRLRLQAAVAWGWHAVTAADPGQAAHGYAAAVELLPALAPRQLARGDAEHGLTRYPGLASDAAACALADGDAERAVALLELGRGILLGQALQGRTELAELAEHAPGLARRLAELRAALAAGDDADAADADADSAADRRHALAAEWDDLLSRIRALPGREHFLRPPPLQQLLQHAERGPVVLVNVSRYRCDALILTPAGLRVVPLPRLTLGELIEAADRFLTALDRLAHPAGTGGAGRLEHERTLAAGLAWLWDTVAEPVLDALGLAGPPPPGAPWPRVWWVPTGPLAFLPLHAAGHPGARDGRSVLDRAVSSYAPTVRALAHARRPAAGGTGRYLVVAMPETPGASPLRGARREGATLAGLLPGARLLSGSQATRDAVVAGLQEHDWLHFCGHGYADPVSPSASRLLVHDHAGHPLTVTDISRLELREAELAFLSACTTARGGLALADEALHLASAVQLAGYRHVVGTLWAIDDALAARTAERVYAGLGAPHPVADGAARAVHAAVRAARDEYPAMPSLWAAHVHVGA
jgi:hypothetical protein